MRSWWGKSSSKDTKKSTNKESLFDTLHRKFRNKSEGKVSSRSRGSRRHSTDAVSEKGSRSRAETRSPSLSREVSRCQSFVERSNAQPLPLPNLHTSSVGPTDSTISISTKSRTEKGTKLSLLGPLPRLACIKSKPDPADLDGDLVTAFSDSSIDSDDPADSIHHSPQTTDYESGARTAASSPSKLVLKDQPPTILQINSRDAILQSNILSYTSSSTSPKRRPLGSHVPNLQVPIHGAFFSAPDSFFSSPSGSPKRVFSTEQVINSSFWAGRPYQDVTLLSSGHCSSPGSGQNSGHNSMGGDMSGQLFWQQNWGSPEYSPTPSPRMTSPGPSSRIQSGAVTPVHPRAGGTVSGSQSSRPDDGKQQSHRLPLPPVTISNPLPFSHSNSAAASPSVPRSPGRAENPPSPGSRWKKGKLLGRGTFGHVYVAFNSESGEMCAMKEVTLFSDDAKSKESAKQLMQEIALLSRLRHPNIVQYYGSEKADDRLYIYLEYVSGGSIFKLLREYGQLGESVIRSYTQQILSGLAYLHAKNTVHRDIKGANILVDPNGRVKLADFGMAKHITGQSCPLSFKGSPYWMAPEVIKNSNGCNLRVDIWSLGCTVLEMATTKPPWSQYEGVAAMFKIGNSKELPAIPDYLSNEGKDFVCQCLQRNPLHRPTAAQLLDHPFVKYAAPLERPVLGPDPPMPPSVIPNGIAQARASPALDSERLAVLSSRRLNTVPLTGDIHIPRNLSCPVSPIGSPLLNARSPQHHNGRLSPSPISSPRTTSGPCTPFTGGSGSIPFGYLKHSICLQDGFGGMARPTNGFYGNRPSHGDGSPDIFRGTQPGAHIFSELVPGDNDVLGKQFGRSAQVESYNGQLVLADRVSRQLLRDHVKMNPSLDLSLNSTFPGGVNGV